MKAEESMEETSFISTQFEQSEARPSLKVPELLNSIGRSDKPRFVELEKSEARTEMNRSPVRVEVPNVQGMYQK